MTLEINTAFDVGDVIRFRRNLTVGTIKKVNLKRTKGNYLVTYLVEYNNEERRWAEESYLDLVEKAAEEPKPEGAEEPEESSGEVNP